MNGGVERSRQRRTLRARQRGYQLGKEIAVRGIGSRRRRISMR
jgi:hypothetical protein